MYFRFTSINLECMWICKNKQRHKYTHYQACITKNFSTEHPQLTVFFKHVFQFSSHTHSHTVNTQTSFFFHTTKQASCSKWKTIKEEQILRSNIYSIFRIVSLLFLSLSFSVYFHCVVDFVQITVAQFIVFDKIRI